MKIINHRGSYIPVENIEQFICLPRYAGLGEETILLKWSVEADLTSGSAIELKIFKTEEDAQNFLDDLIKRLGWNEIIDV